VDGDDQDTKTVIQLQFAMSTTTDHISSLLVKQMQHQILENVHDDDTVRNVLVSSKSNSLGVRVREEPQEPQEPQDEAKDNTFRVIVRSKRKGVLCIPPSKSGGITWVSGIITHNGKPPKNSYHEGVLTDVLIDEHTTTIDSSTTTTTTLTNDDWIPMSEHQQEGPMTKDGSHLYFLSCQSRAEMNTRPNAVVLYGLSFYGQRTAPLSEEELFNQPDDPAMHKTDKGDRATVFAQWLVSTFGRHQLRSGSGVIDVAAGRGDLSAEVSVLNILF
jgi:hypothetical protein